MDKTKQSPVEKKRDRTSPVEHPPEVEDVEVSVDQNDLPFRSAFPYVALPHSGFDGAQKRIEPEHAPTTAQP